eukprot:1060990-Heterocapsa_arctica.AAC.1
MDRSEKNNKLALHERGEYRTQWRDGMGMNCLERADGSTCGRDSTDDMHTNRTDRVQKCKRLVGSLQRNTVTDAKSSTKQR